MRVEQLEVGSFASNCYIVWEESSRLALVIDPGEEANRIVQFLDEKNLTVLAYPLTHGHIDHISALIEVSAKYPAPIGIHPDDGKWAFEPINQIPPYYPGLPTKPTITRHFSESQTWEDGPFKYSITETPGHSPGGVCFYFQKEGILFSGDTLFKQSVGRTDLPGGNMPTLQASLKKVSQFPEETIIYPGHGPQTILADELRENPFLAQ